MHKVIALTCPGCGAKISLDQKKCEYCGSPILISTFNSVYAMPLSNVNKYAQSFREALSNNPDNNDLNNSIGMCYLKLKLYEKAVPAFEKAIESNFDNSETYFYAAIALLQGKKPFLQQKKVIERIEEYLNAALAIEPKGIYYYFLAYVKYDFYERKYFRTSPTYLELLNQANHIGVSEFDVNQLFEILGTPIPNCFK